MIGVGIGLTRGHGTGTRYTLADFAPAFILRAPKLSDPLVGNARGTLTFATSSTNIISATDSAGGSVVLTRVAAGRECTYDTSVPFNARGAVRITGTQALRTITGGVNAANAPHYLAALARPVAVVNNASNFGTWALYGQPIGLNTGIGSATPPNSHAWGGNTIGASLWAPFDTSVHYFESSYDGTTLRGYIDGVLINKRTVSITFNGPEGAGFGFQSWFEAARAVPDTMIYAGAFKNSEPTFSDRMRLAALLGEGAHSIPMRIIGKGDSRTLGTGSTSGHDYLSQVTALFASAGRTVVTVNHGLSGKRSDEIVTALDVRDVGELHSPFCTNVSVLWPGYNDFNQYTTVPTSAAIVYANTRAMIDFDRSYGNKVYTMTVPTSGPFEATPPARALMFAYNDLVRANAGGADGVIDLAPLFEPYDSAKYSDSVHFTDASQLVIAQAVYAALSGLP